MIYFSVNLQYIRKLKKINQSYIANEIGVKSTSISNYEQGISFPDYDKLIKISKILGVSIDDLLTEDISKKNEYPFKDNKQYENLKNEYPICLENEYPIEYPLKKNEYPKLKNRPAGSSFECLECKLKDQIITSKEETIKALQATTDAQKKQIDMLEDIISNNDTNGHSGGQKRKAG